MKIIKRKKKVKIPVKTENTVAMWLGCHKNTIKLWNSLPENLRAAETVDVFKKRLKTHLFNLAFI